MNYQFSKHSKKPNSHPKAFTLIITLSMLVLLTLIAIGLLSLSTSTLRASASGKASAEARANARMALLMALGELQKEMGPDMRVSAKASLQDSNPDSPQIEGVAQPHWLSTYDSWGAWLNAQYTPPGKSNMRIQDTYGPNRSNMFRRWLVSMPTNMMNDVRAAVSPGNMDHTNSAIMVGRGTLGAAADLDPSSITRAYLMQIGTNGRHAWWISPENQKALIHRASIARNLSPDAWQASQGNTAEVGVSALQGLGGLADQPEVSSKLISYSSLRAAQIDGVVVQNHFFDLTATSQGVLASVRSGHLKKDISLLFEQDNTNLDPLYRYSSGRGPEPSIRPMSQDLLSLNPKVTRRHFASWTNMRHFYRMYRNSSDATLVPSSAGTGGAATLLATNSMPYSQAQIPLLHRDIPATTAWLGDNAYLRMPILAKLTFIYSLIARPVGVQNPNNPQDNTFRHELVYTPVYVYWNPYNTELQIPDNTLGCLSSTYQVLPMSRQLFKGTTPIDVANHSPVVMFSGNAHSFLRSGNGSNIVFKPGELRVFSHAAIGSQNGGQNVPLDLVPGFNPLSYGGDVMNLGNYKRSDNLGIKVMFSHSEWGGNVSYGNTPGSLCHTPFWLPAQRLRNEAFQWNFPMMYQNDWFNLSQTYTSMTPSGNTELMRWVYGDTAPSAVAYAQLVLKGVSQFQYQSINWAKDWRSRNWIQSPPFYFGNSLYMSENESIANTQRIDNPYVMNFGPTSSSELPEVVGQIGSNAFFGSGRNPVERVTSVPALELPTAPISSLASFSGMRINPGWVHPSEMNSNLGIASVGGNNTSRASFAYSLVKSLAYQSGITGPGIGNSFMHPMIPRTGVLRSIDNSTSADPADRRKPLADINFNDNRVFSDYWDHVYLLNDALWDDYFVSSLSDQLRAGATSARNLDQNVNQMIRTGELPNTRYRYISKNLLASDVSAELLAANGYLNTAKHLMVDGSFNVNSTSVAAWQALFAGIRERKMVFRDDSGNLRPIEVPSGKRIGISRFDTEVANSEMNNITRGVSMASGLNGWSGIRFLDDAQILRLAEQCVKQVKLRGPFLNFAEFINRRLSNDELGTLGALQSAIDYDDRSPETGSINYPFKLSANHAYMMKEGDLGGSGSHIFATPQAVEGSRLAGVPGYVIQSDLLKPIANTLSVRDDTFMIRAYGESLDATGNVIARAWCEAHVQRLPEYCDTSNDASVPKNNLSTAGEFSINQQLSAINQRFGRKFVIQSFRWLSSNEI